MIKKILRLLFGCTINILEIKNTDILHFEVSETATNEDIEWLQQALKKAIKANVIITRMVTLKEVIRKDDGSK